MQQKWKKATTPDKFRLGLAKTVLLNKKKKNGAQKKKILVHVRCQNAVEDIEAVEQELAADPEVILTGKDTANELLSGEKGIAVSKKTESAMGQGCTRAF